jgi:hypothetical protein
VLGHGARRRADDGLVVVGGYAIVVEKYLNVHDDGSGKPVEIVVKAFSYKPL